MSVGLCMIVRDEAETLAPALESAIPLIDHWTIVDTGSTDGTQDVVRETLADVPGELHEREWRNFGDNLTEMLELAQGSADWLLRLDADLTVEAHPDLREWLADDHADVDAWQVEIADNSWVWRLPMLVRGSLDWHYVGAAHSYLHSGDRNLRSLLGLTLRSRRSGGHDPERFKRNLELLRPGYYAGERRATFYYAETLKVLGRHGEAIEVYRRRARMDGFEEEGWYAAYQAAKLLEDVPALIAAWERRPWRHEPLTAAARIVAREHGRNDLLFQEPAP